MSWILTAQNSEVDLNWYLDNNILNGCRMYFFIGEILIFHKKIPANVRI